MVSLLVVDAVKAVNAVFKAFEETLKAGDKVAIVNFGSFQVVRRNAREGRNPQTGKPINIPAKKVVRFKPGKSLKK